MMTHSEQQQRSANNSKSIESAKRIERAANTATAEAMQRQVKDSPQTDRADANILRNRIVNTRRIQIAMHQTISRRCSRRRTLTMIDGQRCESLVRNRSIRERVRINQCPGLACIRTTTLLATTTREKTHGIKGITQMTLDIRGTRFRQNRWQ